MNNSDGAMIVNSYEDLNEPQTVADEMLQDGTDQPSAVTQAPTFDISAYNATVETIRRRLGIMEKSLEEIKTLKDMYKTVLQNEPTYIEAEEAVKDAQTKRKGILDQINKLPNVASMIGKVKDLKEQLKSNEESLTLELMDYYKTAGVTEIEDEQGNVQEFTFSARLKTKRKTE